MNRITRFSALVYGGLCALALAALTPTAAWAQAKECNGFINISYPNFPPTPLEVPPPKEFDVQINLGTGTITGGITNSLVVDSFAVQLACWAGTPGNPAPLIPICEPDGPPNFPPQKIEFVGMVQDACGGSTFTPSIGGIGNNVLTLTASTPLVMPANVPPLSGFCAVRFTLRAVQGFSSDTITPGEIEETANYALALCDNGVLVSAGGQSASVPVTPTPGNPFIGYETKVQNLTATLGGTITIPLLGLSQPLPPTDTVTLKRLLTPAAPGNIQATHLAAYAGFPLPKAGGRKVTVDTIEFGQLMGKLGFPSFVLIDAAKSLTGPIPPVPIDRVFACYGLEKPLPGKIDWVDQFGPGNGSLRGTTRLCFPADLNGAVGALQLQPLLCARVEKTTLGPNYQERVWIGSEWGPSDAIKLEGVDDFCAAVTQITVSP